MKKQEYSFHDIKDHDGYTIKKLKINKEATVLDFRIRHTIIRDAHIAALCKFLSTNNTIRELYLEALEGEKHDQIALLVDGLQKNTSLTKLSLTRICFSDKAIPLLTQYFKTNTNLKVLTVSYYQKLSNDFKTIFDARFKSSFCFNDTKRRDISIERIPIDKLWEAYGVCKQQSLFSNLSPTAETKQIIYVPWEIEQIIIKYLPFRPIKAHEAPEENRTRS